MPRRMEASAHGVGGGRGAAFLHRGCPPLRKGHGPVDSRARRRCWLHQAVLPTVLSQSALELLHGEVGKHRRLVVRAVVLVLASLQLDDEGLLADKRDLGEVLRKAVWAIKGIAVEIRS